MGVKFKSPLELSGHRSILHTDAAQTLIVKVVAKTAAHPEQGNGSSNGYTIDGVEGAYLEFTPGNTYKFDQSDSSNTGHPLRFYEDAAKTIAYTTGVTTNGTAGSSGAYTQIIPTISTPPVLFYQCSAHSLMGSYVKFGTATAAGSNTTYTISSETSGADAIIRLTGSDSTTDDVTLAAGSNITITETGDTITLSSESTDQVRVACKNTSGSTITKGTPVYVTGSVGASATVTIAPANAASASTMPASGLLLTDLANNGQGHIVTGGVLKNLITDPIDGVTPSANATLYVKSGGGLTATKPTGTALIQNVGKVGRVSTSSDGSILVSSILRSNDIPNIQQGYIWLGDSNGVPVATSHILSNLTDVASTSPSTGQVLKYNGSEWAPGTDASGSGASNSFETIAISGQSSVVADSATDTLTLVAGDNITLTTDAGTDTITVASSGGSPTLNVEKNILTGDGSTVAFTVSSSIVSENNTQVYIDGVYQSKDNYSTSGSTVTFTTAPPNGAEIEIIHFVSVQGAIKLDSFTGDNSTVTFATGASIIDENNTQVYIDGVYQSKDNYTTSGSNITFSTAPGTGAIIEVVHIKAIDLSTIVGDQLTGDGSTVAFTLSRSIDDENNTFVFINGVYQDKSTYSLSGTTLTFSTAPQNGYTIEVMSFDSISIASTGVTTVNDLSGDLTIAAGNGISISKNTSTKTLTIANTLIDTTVSYNTPTGQSLTYTTPSSSTGQAGSVYGPQTFTITGGANITLSGTASISGLPNGLTLDSQSYNNTNASNVLTITLGGVFPSANSLNTNLTISGLTATTALIVDYLVAAGGGGGGGVGGGGGAGGLRTSYGNSGISALTLTPSASYTVTVGAGGGASATGGAWNYDGNTGANGSNSVFSTITSLGGGGGTGGSNTAGSGGSGGGARSGTAGTGTSGQGNNGATGDIGGGGGGAGAAGSSNASGSCGADGGDGLSVSITGSSVAYAGGGGGGASFASGCSATSGGIGGGGDAGANDGTANTGGGGGGGSWTNNASTATQKGGNGGSGIVILRYANAFTITVGSGLTSSTATDGSDKITSFTAGTGSISFS